MTIKDDDQQELDAATRRAVRCFADLPDDAILRLPAVEVLTGLSEKTLRRKVEAGELPPMVQLSSRAVGQRVGAVRRLLAKLDEGPAKRQPRGKRARFTKVSTAEATEVG